jgi:stage V sporulation protein T
MENNGIIRRIDDLGRIVIPREYRKLHGIDLGDPIEITALSGGEIMLKKVDTGGELIKNAKKIISAAEVQFDGTLFVTDGERWLWGRGENKSILIEQPVTKWVRSAVKERESLISLDGGEGDKVGVDAASRVIFVPAISGGDCFGALCLVSSLTIPPEQVALVSVLGKILGEYMNKY